MSFRKFVIVGPGLIGGSVGMGVKNASLADTVVGVGHRQMSIDRAIDLGAIDHGSLDLEEAAKEADFLLLCTRVNLFADMVRRVAPCLAENAIISDVGSTKREVVAAVEDALGNSSAVFIGAHPLAGSEKRGIDAACPRLFDGSRVILTPGKRSTPTAEESVERLWTALGAHVSIMTPETHDAILAEISHLPHVVAAAVVNAVSDKALAFASTGFRDATRIASGDPELWRDICATNRDNLIAALSRVAGEIHEFRAALEEGDDDALERLLHQARQRRDGGHHGADGNHAQ